MTYKDLKKNPEDGIYKPLDQSINLTICVEEKQIILSPARAIAKDDLEIVQVL